MSEESAPDLPERYKLPEQHPQPEHHFTAPEPASRDSSSPLSNDALIRNNLTIMQAVAAMASLRRINREPTNDPAFRPIRDALLGHEAFLIDLVILAMEEKNTFAHREAYRQLETVCRSLRRQVPANVPKPPLIV